MRVYEILAKKRDGGTLEDGEIAFLVRGLADGGVADYQAAAFLMAACIRGLDAGETAALTKAMMESGDVLDLSDVDPRAVDKHSTGGVGDKCSLVLAPAVAACGATAALMAGRGLGHTGGTLDKLEAIPGYRTRCSPEEFKATLRAAGCAIVGQGERLAPADRTLYALRDVTGTVESIPLITASIMSKKLAAGAAALVMDVKFGSGAFVPDLAAGRELAAALAAAGARAGRPVVCYLTAMDRPLGLAVGNALEVRESLDCLRGAGPADLRELTLVLGAEMLVLAGRAPDLAAGRARIAGALDDGSALDRFRAMVADRGGDVSVLDDPDRLPRAALTLDVPAPRAGYVAATDCRALGVAAILLGAGREHAADEIDPATGLEVLKKPGETVAAGEPLVRLHAGPASRVDEARARCLAAFRLAEASVTATPLVAERIA